MMADFMQDGFHTGSWFTDFPRPGRDHGGSPPRTGLCEPAQLKASESRLGSLNQLTCTKATARLLPWGAREVENISSRLGMLA